MRNAFKKYKHAQYYDIGLIILAIWVWNVQHFHHTIINLDLLLNKKSWLFAKC